MLKKLTILYIGRNPEITDTMKWLLNGRAESEGFTTCLDEEALAMWLIPEETITNKQNTDYQ